MPYVPDSRDRLHVINSWFATLLACIVPAIAIVLIRDGQPPLSSGVLAAPKVAPPARGQSFAALHDIAVVPVQSQVAAAPKHSATPAERPGSAAARVALVSQTKPAVAKAPAAPPPAAQASHSVAAKHAAKHVTKHAIKPAAKPSHRPSPPAVASPPAGHRTADPTAAHPAHPGGHGPTTKATHRGHDGHGGGHGGHGGGHGGHGGGHRGH